MSSKDLECYECIYNDKCPVNWSRHNAACLTIRKLYEEATTLYNILNDMFSRKKLDDEMEEQLNWDHRAHENPYGG